MGFLRRIGRDSLERMGTEAYGKSVQFGKEEEVVTMLSKSNFALACNWPFSR